MARLKLVRTNTRLPTIEDRRRKLNIGPRPRSDRGDYQEQLRRYNNLRAMARWGSAYCLGPDGELFISRYKLGTQDHPDDCMCCRDPRYEDAG